MFKPEHQLMGPVPSSQPNGSSHACALHCPVCDTQLNGFQWKKSDLDICPKGCGTWFDHGELHAVESSDTLENLDRAFEGRFVPVMGQGALGKEDLEKDAPRKCPRDGSMMRRFEWNRGSGIAMDACPECDGTWLDAGELEGFAAYVKRFRENPPELTPELKAKLDDIQMEMDAEFEHNLNAVTRKVVRWNAGLLDDVLRAMLKGLVRHGS